MQDLIMDAQTPVTTLSLDGESWLMRTCEHGVRCVAVALVLTGQMLPAGAVSAQEDPPSPTFVAPPPPEVTGVEATDVPSKDAEAITPELAEEAPLPSHSETKEPQADVTPPTQPQEAATLTEPKPAPEAPQPDERTPLIPSPAKDEAVPDPNPANELPAIEPASPVAAVIGESSVNFGDWTMTIRPGVSTPKRAPFIQTPVGENLVPQNQISVPVNVHVNQIAPQTAAWSAPWTYPAYWTAPSSAYLFQRPQPYWQLRQDFYHLRPFIPGLW